jgi:hypothetical protein
MREALSGNGPHWTILGEQRLHKKFRKIQLEKKIEKIQRFLIFHSGKKISLHWK